MKSFYDDLRAFQQKYPMVYVEAWTPEDFVFAAEGDHDEAVQLSPDQWADPGHVLTANALAEGFDANHGTFWDRVREAVSCPV
jgi:hypothetical protein